MPTGHGFKDAADDGWDTPCVRAWTQLRIMRGMRQTIDGQVSSACVLCKSERTCDLWHLARQCQPARDLAASALQAPTTSEWLIGIMFSPTDEGQMRAGLAVAQTSRRAMVAVQAAER